MLSPLHRNEGLKIWNELRKITLCRLDSSPALSLSLSPPPFKSIVPSGLLDKSSDTPNSESPQHKKNLKLVQMVAKTQWTWRVQFTCNAKAQGINWARTFNSMFTPVFDLVYKIHYLTRLYLLHESKFIKHLCYIYACLWQALIVIFMNKWTHTLNKNTIPS